MVRSFLLLVACAATLIFQTSGIAAERPNVLLIVTDDQGSGDFSRAGNPVLKTPHLDRLAEQSIRFSDFHSAPMCTPTRGQLMTGLDAVRNGATSVTGGRSFLRPGLPTLPSILREAGYQTGIFGKWHLGDHFPHRPMDRGFEKAVWHLGWGFTSAPEFANTLFDGRYFDDDRPAKFQGHCTDHWFSRAQAWMREQQSHHEPFFCYLPLNAPHAPHVVAEEYREPYQGKGPAPFFGMISQIDENIGKMETFLQETGLRDNTIVIFMTDNGGTAGVKLFNAGLREGKTTYYEGGHRVPCWIRWPKGKLGTPREIDVPTQVQDVLPTVLELTDTKPPEKNDFDGESLVGFLRGQRPLLGRTFVVQYSRAKLAKWECCVIQNQWRLVHGTELYDVRADRAQTKDLATEHPDQVKKMRAHYEKWWDELEPLSNQFIQTSIGANEEPIVQLTSADWQDVYCDNANHIREAVGGPRGGHWNLRCETEGTYRVTLRRWPTELNLPLNAAAPAAESGNARAVAGKALPIRIAKLKVDESEYTAQAQAEDDHVSFEIEIHAGSLALQAWFQDIESADLCGAFFVTVERL